MPKLTRKMKGGELPSNIKKKIRNTYKIPDKVVRETGRLVNTEEQFFATLKSAGLNYPKKEFPKVDENYYDIEEFSEVKINDEIKPLVYKSLYPIESQSKYMKDIKWIYFCGVCPEDKESCDLSNIISGFEYTKPKDQIDIENLKKEVLTKCKKIPDLSTLDMKIKEVVNKNNKFFKQYLYYLPWALESNTTFYEKTIDFGVQLGIFTEGEKEILKDSLSWQILGCQPCMMHEGKKRFCIDPFYLNESIEWVSNIYNEPMWTSSEGLAIFKRKAEPLLKKYIKKYNIKKSEKPKWFVDDLDKYKESIHALIIMYEQNENREVFQKIQFFMTIIKLLLSNYVILQPVSTTIVEELPFLDQYIVTAEVTRYGCIASIGREIESKMKKINELFSAPGFENALSVYRDLDPFENNELKNEYVSEFKEFIDDFLKFIAPHASMIEIIKKVLNKNIEDYRKYNSPLYLKGKEAEELGICSDQSAELIGELEFLFKLYSSKEGGKRKTRKRKFKKMNLKSIRKH